MRVAVYPADQGGCGHYRLIWPARALAGQGADVWLRDGEAYDDIQAVFHVDDTGHRELLHVDAGDADVVVIQRPLRRELADSIPILQQGGVRVVVDIDDDFSCIHPNNVSWRGCHPAYNPQRNWQHLARACRDADLVTVSTPALADRYAGHGRVAVIPNCVPARYLEIVPEPDDGLFVGWSGSIDTHPEDLQQTRGGVSNVIHKTIAELAVVGTGKGVQAALGLVEPPRASGWLEIDDYPAAVAQLDVGIVPLAPSRFNQAKSWLKGLEMAAVGVPFVASPVVEYERLAKHGAGRLAVRGRDWEREVTRLIVDEGARVELSGRGREVAARWTIEGNTDRWWDAWQSVKDRRAAA